MMKFYNGALLLMMCFSSCAFNSRVYQPDKVPVGFKQLRIVTAAKDTNYINVDKTFQPTFTDSKGQLLPLTYTFESVNFKNEQNDNIVGWFIQPKDKANTKVTVLFLYGNGGSIISSFFAVLPLVKKGMQVFIPDYRGYGFSEGKPCRMGVLNDVEHGLQLMSKRDDVKGTKLVIYGTSMGGQLAAVTAVRNEAIIDGVVMEGAITSYKDMAGRMFGFPGRLLMKQGYSSIKSVPQIHKPILIIHSAEDKVAPLSMGKRLFARANEPKSFYEIKHGHIEGLNYYADSIAARIYTLVK
ncbi:MAG: alpha/beta hydrolase fold-containing protein [Flavipsychrobacter sp.]|nr:alpha/beta hydrolase fold-containing protein [Flavipsychrobacter sp.]